MPDHAKPIVAIGVPSGDMVHTDFAMSLAMLCMNPGAHAFLLNSRSPLVALGRNECAGAAQVMRATHLLFLDTDMVFPADTVTRLLAHNKDIVGASYASRMPPFQPVTVAEEGVHIRVTAGLQRVKLIPAGCLMIRVAVFNVLAKPYFNLALDGDQLCGEDVYFCHKAREAGFELWCDGDLSSQIGHIGQKIHRLSDVAMQRG